MQAQRQIATRGQHRVHVGRKVCQQPGQLSERLRRGQLVQIVDDQDEAAALVGELREHPVDHRPPIEVGCRGWRFRAAGGAGGLADRAEQGQPELLGVALVALHLQDGEPVRLTRTVGPGAQQRRLPAAGWGRDDRHLPRRRAIQSGEKITPVDQPGSCSSHRQRPALVPAPDALAVGDPVLLAIRPAHAVSTARSPGPGDRSGSPGPVGKPGVRTLDGSHVRGTHGTCPEIQGRCREPSGGDRGRCRRGAWSRDDENPGRQRPDGGGGRPERARAAGTSRRCPPRGGRHDRPRSGDAAHRPDRRRSRAPRRAGEHHRCVPARRRAHHDSRGRCGS